MSLKSLSRKYVNDGLGRLGRRLPLGLSRRLIRRSPVGFFYHMVADEPLAHVRHLYPYKSSTAFEQDILYIKKHFTLVAYADLKACVESGRQMPANAAFLSFDDGFAECHSVVRPVLEKHGVPCLFFLATDWIDNRSIYYRSIISLVIDALAGLKPGDLHAALRDLQALPGVPAPLQDFQSFSSWLLGRQHSDRDLLDRICRLLGVDIEAYLENHKPFLTRANIRAMQAAGFTFGAHTRSHPKLMNLPVEAQREEIIESCRLICELTGQDQAPFAFPFSGHRVDRDMLAELRSGHSLIGLIFDTKKLDQDRPFVLNRIMVDKPVAGVPARDNIAYWLKDAYALQVKL